MGKIHLLSVVFFIFFDMFLFVSSFSRSTHNLFRTKISPSHYEKFGAFQYFFKQKYVRCSNFESKSSNLFSSDVDFETEKARIVFLGTPEVAVDTLREIVKESQMTKSLYNVVCVVTQPPKRKKRGKTVTPSPVGEIAEKMEIPVLCPDKANDEDFLIELEETYRPDLCITAAYGQYLPKRFLAIPKYGTVNIHPSLLPKYRGASPVQRSLESGENPVGVSLLYTVKKMDAGPIIIQKEQYIDEVDQATQVLPLLFRIGTQSLLQVLPSIFDETITFQNSSPQNDELATAAPMIDSSEGQLYVWKQSARTCHNRVRGFSIWPGTYIYFQVNKKDALLKVKIIETRVREEKVQPSHDVMLLGKNDGLGVVCFDGSVLEVLKLQPVTKKVMDAKSFVNGLQGQALKWVSHMEKSN